MHEHHIGAAFNIGIDAFRGLRRCLTQNQRFAPAYHFYRLRGVLEAFDLVDVAGHIDLRLTLVAEAVDLGTGFVLYRDRVHLPSFAIIDQARDIAIAVVAVQKNGRLVELILDITTQIGKRPVTQRAVVGKPSMHRISQPAQPNICVTAIKQLMGGEQIVALEYNLHRNVGTSRFMEQLKTLLVLPMNSIDNIYVTVNGSLIKDKRDSKCPANRRKSRFLDNS